MKTLTPISELFNAIAASPFRVAPEAATGLEGEIENLNITLEFTDKPEIYADYVASTDNAKIRLGVPFISALWAAAYAYIVAYHEYQIAQRKGERYLALGKIPRVADAYQLYRSARDAVASCEQFQWPQGARKPLRYPFEHSDGYKANELFLVAISWIIHHEIAHARLGHNKLTVASIAEEVDADKSATRTICAGEADNQRLHKRAMGVGAAIVFLLALDLQAGRTTTTTHPLSFERLLNNLDLTGLDEDQMIYDFAFVLVDIHIAEKGINEDIDRNGKSRDMCVSACMLLRSLGQQGV